MTSLPNYEIQGTLNTHNQKHLPESQSLVQFLQETSVELVDGVDVGEQEGHQAFGHGVFFDHSTTEPLGAAKRKSHVSTWV